jgi:hypothetical protein
VGQAGRRIWTPQGNVSADAPIPTAAATQRGLSELMASPAFATNIDAQVAVIHHLRQHRTLLGDTTLATTLHDLCEHLHGVTPHRLTGILQLNDPVEVREALEATYQVPRPTEPGEDLYPKKGWIGAYLAYARESNAPIGYHFWNATLLLGCAARRNLYLPLGYRLYPNPYVFLIGDSAIGKGISISRSMPIADLANHFYIQTMQEYTSLIGMEAPPNRGLTILPEDVNPESFIKILNAQVGEHALPTNPDNLDAPGSLMGVDHSTILANEELVTLADKQKYGSGRLFQFLTAMYTKADTGYAKGTVLRDIERIPPGTISVMLGSTVEWINRSVSADMFEGGFMSRCIFVYRTGTTHQFFDISPAADPVLKHALARSLVPFMLLTPPRAAVLTPSARALWADMRRDSLKQMASTHDERMRPYYKRKDNHIGKVALALLASNLVTDFSSFDVERLEAMPSYTLNVETLEQAIAIVEYEEQFLPECFARIGEHKDQRKVDQLVDSLVRYQKVEGKAMPAYLLNKAARSLWGMDSGRAVALLETQGVLRRITTETKGRPGVAYTARDDGRAGSPAGSLELEELTAGAGEDA